MVVLGASIGAATYFPAAFAGLFKGIFIYLSAGILASVTVNYTRRKFLHGY